MCLNSEPCCVGDVTFGLVAGVAGMSPLAFGREKQEVTIVTCKMFLNFISSLSVCLNSEPCCVGGVTFGLVAGVAGMSPLAFGHEKH